MWATMVNMMNATAGSMRRAVRHAGLGIILLLLLSLAASCVAAGGEGTPSYGDVSERDIRLQEGMGISPCLDRNG